MSPGRTKNIDVAQGQASAALDSYLTSGAKLQDAVSRFTRPVSDLHDHATADESSIGNALDALWTAILNTVLSTPYTDPKQDRLVSFINAIKSLPPPGQHRPQIWGLSLWPDLPILGATMRERWNIGPNAENDDWPSLNAFAARLTASQVLDLSLYAIWVMRDTLETPLEDIKPEWRDQMLRAAALWIEFCSEHLHSLEQTWEPDPRKGDVARGGPLYNGHKGFCKERWELWRRRFGVLSEEESLETETRKMLGDATRRMDTF